MQQVINTAEKDVSKTALQRYPVCLKALRKLKSSDIERIMSKELASVVNIEPTMTRRDFSFLGNLGEQGYGYDVNRLIEILNRQLGMGFDKKIILVGVGNMSRAPMKYNKWDYVVGEITCTFNVNPDRQGIRFGISVYGIADLEKKVPGGCHIAILAISESIQQTVDRLIVCGVTGLVDFTHEHIQIPEGIVLKSMDVVSSIQKLVSEADNLSVECWSKAE